MRSALLLTLVLFFGLGAHSGCDDFSKEDIKLLEKYGGLYIPSGEGFAAQLAPVDAVMLDSTKRALSDADFALVFPVIKRMNPYRLHMRGEHTIGDKSIGLLNQLTALRVLDTSGTAMTLEGLKTLKASSLKQLCVSPERFSEEQADELQESLPDVEVARWPDGPRQVGSAVAPATGPATTRASSDPALEAARQELEAAFAERIRATKEKDADALVAMISPDYSADLPDGRRVEYDEIIGYLRRGTEQFIEVTDLSITIEKLELRGEQGEEPEAVVDARQRFARSQRLADGQVHEVFTTVLQTEVWVRNPAGWQLRSVSDLREQQSLIDGQPVEQGR